MLPTLSLTRLFCPLCSSPSITCPSIRRLPFYPLLSASYVFDDERLFGRDKCGFKLSLRVVLAKHAGSLLAFGGQRHLLFVNCIENSPRVSALGGLRLSKSNCVHTLSCRTLTLACRSSCAVGEPRIDVGRVANFAGSIKTDPWSSSACLPMFSMGVR